MLALMITFSVSPQGFLAQLLLKIQIDFTPFRELLATHLAYPVVEAGPRPCIDLSSLTLTMFLEHLFRITPTRFSFDDATSHEIPPVNKVG